MIVNFYNKINVKPFGPKFARQILEQAVENLRLDNNFEITVLLVSPSKIKKLNKQYRKIDKVTDVLSFGQNEGVKLILPKEKTVYLGDIVICWHRILEQAKELGHSAKKEFAVILVHGFLHLLGYDHIKEADYKKMNKAELKVIKFVKFQP